MRISAKLAVMAFGIAAALPLAAAAQDNNSVAAPAAPVTADYPKDRSGVLIYGTDWTSIPTATPTKRHLKHRFAPTFTYGIAPATAVADYEGVHAPVQIAPGQPVICLCHYASIPGTPTLVRLHSEKDYRELDGGNVRFGAKPVKAEKNDLIPTNVSQPEPTVWLIQPQQPLPDGEYALMLGTENLQIYPFTVGAGGSPSPPPDEK